MLKGRVPAREQTGPLDRPSRDRDGEKKKAMKSQNKK